jgi:hypothetical protein
LALSFGSTKDTRLLSVPHSELALNIASGYPDERLAFGVWRLAFGVWRLAFGGAVRTSVTLMGQDIGNTVTVLVHVLILSSWN